jgi:guanylate kinase
VKEFDAHAQSQRATALRRARAQLKADIKSGKRDPLEVFDQGVDKENPVVAGLRVEWFLRSLPAWGPTKAHRFLEGLNINPRWSLGGLGVRQQVAFRRKLREVVHPNSPPPAERGSVVVVAGPTAVGKGTVLQRVIATNPEIEKSVSATTRPPREGEVDGVDYHFVDDDRFDQMVALGELLEWATVHGVYRYGTPLAGIEAQQESGKTVVLEIDIQGARQIRRKLPDALFVFIAPPSFDELARRLAKRGTENNEEQQRRLATAVEEMAAKEEFDVIVTNDVVEKSARKVVDLVVGHRERMRE